MERRPYDTGSISSSKEWVSRNIWGYQSFWRLWLGKPQTLALECNQEGIQFSQMPLKESVCKTFLGSSHYGTVGWMTSPQAQDAGLIPGPAQWLKGHVVWAQIWSLAQNVPDELHMPLGGNEQASKQANKQKTFRCLNRESDSAPRKATWGPLRLGSNPGGASKPTGRLSLPGRRETSWRIVHQP